MALYRIDDFSQDKLRQPNYLSLYFNDRPFQQVDVYSAEGRRIGRAEDLLVDESGRMRYLVVDAGTHKRLLLPSERWERVSDQGRMYIKSLNREEFSSLPEYEVADKAEGGAVVKLHQIAAVGESAPVEVTMPVDYQAVVMGSQPVRSQAASEQDEQDIDKTTDPKASPIQLFEERLVTQTQRVKTGEVKISKHTVTEATEALIPVTKEKIIIEIESVYGGQTQVDMGDAQVAEDGSVRVGIYEEQATVCRQVVPYQNVAIRKETVTDTVVSQEPLRRETLNVETEGTPVVVTNDTVPSQPTPQPTPQLAP
ncbi:MAG: DUF2382 domain-containing protein [Cyanobacteria bacterium J06626_6]